MNHLHGAHSEVFTGLGSPTVQHMEMFNLPPTAKKTIKYASLCVQTCYSSLFSNTFQVIRD